MGKRKIDKEPREKFETVYEGESGAPWVAYLKSKEVDGWQLFEARVTKHIDETHFVGKVVFSRPLPGAK